MNSEFVATLVTVVREVRSTMQEPIEFIVTSPSGYSVGLKQATDGTISQTFETGTPGKLFLPLELHMFDANGKTKLINLVEDCESCQEEVYQ
jgi:hypothetical protein